MFLTLEIDTFLNLSSPNQPKENLSQALQDNMNRNEKLIQCWNGLLPCFKEVIFRYTRVYAKQSRKDLKDSFQMEKNKAHQNELMKKEKKLMQGCLYLI